LGDNADAVREVGRARICSGSAPRHSAALRARNVVRAAHLSASVDNLQPIAVNVTVACAGKKRGARK